MSQMLLGALIIGRREIRERENGKEIIWRDGKKEMEGRGGDWRGERERGERV